MSEETLDFQAEVSKLLDIVVHSLYSDREIFLRELISNASDACDKLRYEALTQPSLLGDEAGFAIRLAPNKATRTLIVSDNGIGMNKADLVNNLGTIARSGTQAFVSALTEKGGDAKADVAQIGRFGVGFYSAFMVASKVDVFSRRAGEAEGWHWSSEGTGKFTITETDAAPERGTSIVLHLRDDCDDYLDEHRLRNIVKTYSDHIAQPVQLLKDPEEAKKEAEERAKAAQQAAEEAGEDAPIVDVDPGEAEPETLNAASALWTRNKSEVTDEQYGEFFRHVSHGYGEPWYTLHYRAEGAIEYTSLLFIPKDKPFDLFTQERKTAVKLYVNRVFITDDCEDLLPTWLRFVKGIVDSPDLPLNVSREMLQQEPMLRKIRNGLVKRLVSDLKKKAEAESKGGDTGYKAFWENFGPVLKEGLYEDFERREDLLDLGRFASTRSAEAVSLADYVEGMKEGQDAIYYVTGDDADALRRSPQVEGFLARDIEVLVLTDPIDEFWTGSVQTYKDKPFKAVAEAGDVLDKIDPVAKSDAAEGEDADKA
ncbi:MAG: molecular chaperone HtpG, partial [Rhodospirillaceae bacterium]